MDEWLTSAMVIERVWRDLCVLRHMLREYDARHMTSYGAIEAWYEAQDEGTQRAFTTSMAFLAREAYALEASWRVHEYMTRDVDGLWELSLQCDMMQVDRLAQYIGRSGAELEIYGELIEEVR